MALKAIARSGITLGLAVGLTVGTASMAAAAQQHQRTAVQLATCSLQKGISLVNGPGSRVYGSDYLACVNSSGHVTITNYPVSIYQLNSSGAWVLVASGSGSASYTCHGTTLRGYMGEGQQDIFACG